MLTSHMLYQFTYFSVVLARYRVKADYHINSQ